MFTKNTAAKILFILIVGSSVALPLVGVAQSGGSTVVGTAGNGGNTVVGNNGGTVVGNNGGTAVGTASGYSAPNIWGVPPGFWGPLLSCQGSFLNVPSVNGQPVPPTCSNLCNLIGTFINIIYFLISLSLFIMAPVMIVVGGVMMMLSGANPGMLETGKKILTGTVIGIAIVLCSYLLVNTVLTVLGVTSIGGFNGNSAVCSISP